MTSRKIIKHAGHPKGAVIAIYENAHLGYSQRSIYVDKDSEGFYYRVKGAPNGDLIFESDDMLERYLRGASVAGFQQVV